MNKDRNDKTKTEFSYKIPYQIEVWQEDFLAALDQYIHC